jgi:hypothetical protein
VHRDFAQPIAVVDAAMHCNDAMHTKKQAATFRDVNMCLVFYVRLQKEDVMIKLNTKFIISTIGLLVFSIVYDMFVKGHITGTEVVVSLTMASVVTKLLLLGLIVHIFSLKYENKGIHEGIRFGVLIGLLIGFLGIQGMETLMDKTDVIVKTLLDGILFGVGSGVVLSVLYKDHK